MVRMVNRNLFYNRDSENCDRKVELWRKTEIIRRWENSKFSCDVQNWALEGVFKDKITLTHILEYSWVIPGYVFYGLKNVKINRRFLHIFLGGPMPAIQPLWAARDRFNDVVLQDFIVNVGK